MSAIFKIPVSRDVSQVCLVDVSWEDIQKFAAPIAELLAFRLSEIGYSVDDFIQNKGDIRINPDLESTAEVEINKLWEEIIRKVSIELIDIAESEEGEKWSWQLDESEGAYVILRDMWDDCFHENRKNSGRTRPDYDDCEDEDDYMEDCD